LINFSDQALSLVYHTGGLGDFITAFPAIREWNRQNKGRRKILLGKPSYGILGVQERLFDEIWDVESAAFSWLYNSDSPAHPSIKDKLFDIQSALLFASGDSPVLARFRSLGIQKILFQDPFPQNRIHIADYHFSLFKKDSKTFPKSRVELVPHPDFKNEADKLLEDVGKFIALHPGSGSKIKNWPINKFEELAEKLREKGFRIVWIAGQAEEDLSSPSKDILVRNAPLPLLVHLFVRSCLYVGNDSGISHLAAACGAPSVVLFGPSDPAVWEPLGKKVTIVFKNQAPCFPCHSLAGRGLKNKVAQVACKDHCINNISVLEVFDACKKVMKME
jgi:heptosyltransferase III